MSLLFSPAALAQFSPAFLQNASYWRDGKSEVDFYSADFIREGQHYQTELLLVLTAEFVDPKSLVRLEDTKVAGALPVIRVNEQATIPRGLILEQRSVDGLWRMDSMSLARLWFTGSDGLGHITKSLAENRNGNTVTWKYSCDTYHGNADKPSIASPAGTAVFYDELPVRVRTIDFGKPPGSFPVQLADSIISAREDELLFKPATISYQLNARNITVELKRESGTDTFILDRGFPFLLREWKSADGTQLKLKNSLKAPFENYQKPGDRERALKDPMLRHPD